MSIRNIVNFIEIREFFPFRILVIGFYRPLRVHRSMVLTGVLHGSGRESYLAFTSLHLFTVKVCMFIFFLGYAFL